VENDNSDLFKNQRMMGFLNTKLPRVTTSVQPPTAFPTVVLFHTGGRLLINAVDRRFDN